MWLLNAVLKPMEKSPSYIFPFNRMGIPALSCIPNGRVPLVLDCAGC